uniref:CSON008979 protein n=1 Tax=Culicoides sonorensis TaxID=179676 RepID=A0A336M3C5_CULSO
MNLLIIYISSLFLFTSQPVFGLWSVDVEPDIKSCMPDKKFHLIDVTKLKFVPNTKDQIIRLNGTLKFIHDIDGKIAHYTTSKRFKNGAWVDGEIKSTHPDFCGLISNPIAQPLVFRFYQKGFKQKRCPYKAGHTETFNMVSLTDFPIAMPSDYMGEWKISTTLYKNNKLVECILLEVEVID